MSSKLLKDTHNKRAETRDQPTSEYRAGACNIGPAEISRRKRAGWIGFGASVLLLVIFALLKVQPTFRFIIFVPATISAIGFLQAHMHFCAGFGFSGEFNLSPRLGETQTVESANLRRKDREKATRIVLYSIVIGIVTSVLVWLLPL